MKTRVPPPPVKNHLGVGSAAPARHSAKSLAFHPAVFITIRPGHARAWALVCSHTETLHPPPDPVAELIELKCRNCGSALSPADISPQLSAARCPHCHSLFAIAIPASPAAAQPLPRPEAALPARFSIHREGPDLVISRRWFSHVVWPLIFFAILWNGFLVVWHGIALASGMWFMSVFGLIHTAVGIGLIYFIIATFCNQTVIRAGSGRLRIQHGPVPWRGNQDLASSELHQLFCREKITRGKNGTSTTYQLEAVLRGNTRKTLLKNLPEPEHAIYLEQQLERFLGLTDQRVHGEFPQ